MKRDVVCYAVGSASNPGDPFGRSRVVIQVDGRARLDQHTRSGNSAWTGTVTASALDALWRALEEASFPFFPKHPVPAGSAIRDLNVGGPGGKSVYIAFHAAPSMRGYGTAFSILDTLIRQLSDDTVKVAPVGSVKLVEAVARVSAADDAARPGAEARIAPLSAGMAFLLAYLPASRVEHAAWQRQLDRDLTGADDALRHAVDFARRASKIEASNVAEVDARHRALLEKAGISLPAPPAANGSGAWLVDLAARVGPGLSTPAVEAAWRAGEAARGVRVSVGLAAHMAYLRCAAPADAELYAFAERQAKYLNVSAAALTRDLVATGLRPVMAHAGSVAKMVDLASDLTPSDVDGQRRIYALAREIGEALEAHASQLDPPQSPEATSAAISPALPATPEVEQVAPVHAVPNGLAQRWMRAEPGESLRIRALRSFRDGTRVHVKAERLVANGNFRSWHPVEWVLDAETGETVTGERVPWEPPESELQRARAHTSVDDASLRAVSRDGTLLFFVLGRNSSESWDPDAGTVYHCDASLGLWDAQKGAWRWETSKTPDEMGVGSWLFEQGSFELSFDESGVFGLVNRGRTAMAYDIVDGSFRRARPGDVLPQPNWKAPAEGARVVAADARRSQAVALRGSVLEVWELAGDRLAGTIDVGPLGDTPSAATVLEPGASIVGGTEQGRLFRLDP